MSSLVDFLLERIAEEEVVARATVDLLRGAPRRGGKATAARRLADCTARRRIIEAHPIRTDLSPYAQSCGTGESFGCRVCHDWDGVVCGYGYCPTLLALASVYADHRDFDPGWGITE